ncbi:MAG: arylamine N-acetyltransferase [Rhizobiaceae bacterium]|nr:MAG: arylamine N-acetyltransferase [Rhizobiaceae bacterium]CAG0970230.1 Arylamine N-acetyltransferase / N-hydroxyarylamine O-acetyltransferase [Rhizobiaceae bacterium]
MTFSLTHYLGRIGLDRVDVTVEGLDALVKAQMAAIVFENIEPLLGTVPDLSPVAVWRKLVSDRRGGYCMELNTLLGAALDATGFVKRPFLGRVRMGAATGGPRSHYAWIVGVGGREFLADTGFGGPGAHGIVPLAAVGAEHRIGGRVFRLRADAATGELVLERQEASGWFSLYGFDPFPVTAADVEAANYLCARWEKSPFPSHLMLSRHRAEGRAAMFDTTLTLETAAGTEKRALRSADELSACLDNVFALKIDRREADAVWSRIGGALSDAA